MRVPQDQLQCKAFAGLEVAFAEVDFGQVHFDFEVVGQVPLQYILVKIDGQFVLAVTDAQVRLIQNCLVNIRIRLRDQLVNLLRVLHLVKEGEHVRHAQACEAIILIVRQYIQILVIGLTHQPVLILILTIGYRMGERDVCQTQVAVGVVPGPALYHQCERLSGRVISTHIE